MITTRNVKSFHEFICLIVLDYNQIKLLSKEQPKNMYRIFRQLKKLIQGQVFFRSEIGYSHKIVRTRRFGLYEKETSWPFRIFICEQVFVTEHEIFAREVWMSDLKVQFKCWKNVPSCSPCIFHKLSRTSDKVCSSTNPLFCCRLQGKAYL